MLSPCRADADKLRVLTATDARATMMEQVSTIQMQQVLALECLITAYSMSALYLDGVTKGENQMMATGILLMFASLAFSCTFCLSFVFSSLFRS